MLAPGDLVAGPDDGGRDIARKPAAGRIGQRGGLLQPGQGADIMRIVRDRPAIPAKFVAPRAVPAE